LTDVAMFVSETGMFRGNHLIGPDQARTFVDEYFAEATAVRSKAGEIETLVGQRDAP
jgi:hypothetical protein